MTNAKSILPADLNTIVGLSKNLMDTLEDLFLNKLPEIMKDDYVQQGIDMESFIKELMERTLKNLSSLTIPAMTLKFQSQPTRFYWDITNEILAASEKAKREIVKRHNYQKYDVENDIKKTKFEFEKSLAQQFKTEVKLWKLMDEKRWDDALSIVRAIEIEREGEDMHLRIEVANWKQIIAAHLGYSDFVFQSINSIIDASAEQIMYSPKDANYVVALLLQSELTAFKMSFTQIGHKKAMKELIPTEFFDKQGQEFQEYLIGKIIDALFKERIIRDEKTFKYFLRSTKDNIVKMFKLGNIYVEDVRYY